MKRSEVKWLILSSPLKSCIGRFYLVIMSKCPCYAHSGIVNSSTSFVTGVGCTLLMLRDVPTSWLPFFVQFLFRLFLHVYPFSHVLVRGPYRIILPTMFLHFFSLNFSFSTIIVSAFDVQLNAVKLFEIFIGTVYSSASCVRLL